MRDFGSRKLQQICSSRSVPPPCPARCFPRWGSRWTRRGMRLRLGHGLTWRWQKLAEVWGSCYEDSPADLCVSDSPDHLNSSSQVWQLHLRDLRASFSGLFSAEGGIVFIFVLFYSLLLTMPADQISVTEFVAETNEDYKAPTTSSFTTRMSHCRNTVGALEEVGALSFIRPRFKTESPLELGVFAAGGGGVTRRHFLLWKTADLNLGGVSVQGWKRAGRWDLVALCPPRVSRQRARVFQVKKKGEQKAALPPCCEAAVVSQRFATAPGACFFFWSFATQWWLGLFWWSDQMSKDAEDLVAAWWK